MAVPSSAALVLFYIVVFYFSEEDVTVTMYTAAYQRNLDNAAARQKTGPGKVDSICDAVRQALIDTDENKLVLLVVYL